MEQRKPPDELLTTLTVALGDAYDIERELGGGGMSRVFVATDRTLGRKVVIKVLPTSLQSPALAERFRREVSLLASLRHPHIVPLLAGGDAGGLLYYTMPYVDGESLRVRLDREGALSVAEALRITRQIAEALSYAHKRGVVHRDLKPANVLLDEGGALVADFGIARVLDDTQVGLTGTGMGIGTPGYMAPEQAAADPTTDHRADIYALGAVAYEMLAGRRPYVGSAREVIVAQARGELPSLESLRPGTSPHLSRVVTRALQPDPEARWSSADEILRELESTGASMAVPRTRSRRVAAAASVGLLLTVAIAGYLLRRDESTDHDPSVAVLPFVNMGDSANAYFADGMTEEIINALAGVPGLRVPARTSSFAFKGRNADMREIASSLGVAHVVEGSVRQNANRLRVTAQLIKADDGFHVWSRTFDADARDVFGVQDSISREIVRALLPHLRGEQMTLVRAATDNPEAYAHYLQGLRDFNHRVGNSIPDAITHYRAALELDPNLAAAHAGLASAYAMSFNYVRPQIPGAVDSAIAAARRAIRLDPHSAEGYTALAAALARTDDRAGALEAVRKAVAMNPGYAFGHQIMAYALRAAGNPDSAVVHARTARALDPLSISAWGALAQMYLSARRFSEAEREYRGMLQSDSLNALSYSNYGFFNTARGDYARAIPLLERGEAMDGPRIATTSALALAYQKTGRDDDFRRAAAAADRMVATPDAAQREREAYWMVLLARGQRDAAIDWILRHRETVSARAVPIYHPIFDPLRTHPRFREVESNETRVR